MMFMRYMIAAKLLTEDLMRHERCLIHKGLVLCLYRVPVHGQSMRCSCRRMLEGSLPRQHVLHHIAALRSVAAVQKAGAW